MDGQFSPGSSRRGPPLAERLAQLDHLETVFTRLSREFPANGRIGAQLDAVRMARSIFDEVGRCGTGEFPRDFRAEIEEVRGIFLATGARDADLESWGLV